MSEIINYLKYKIDLGEDELHFFSNPEFMEKEEPEGLKKARVLENYYSQMKDCQECPLAEERTNLVFGTGDPDADIMFIGEAPGAEEDFQGEPFVGRAGGLLDDILDSIDLNREEVYITNILKCRPPENRNPLPQEINQCMPYLEKQREIIKPELICTLGKVASQNILDKFAPLKELREKVYDHGDAKVIPTYHPSALLRNKKWKRPTWEDMKKLKRLYKDL